jgi:uncharacterized membrane protein
MHLLLKLLHIAAVVMFIGNITTGLFWHQHAARTRDPRLLAHTMDGIIRSDRLFTIPSVVIIVITGILAAIHGHFPLLRTGWIAWPILLFVVSGLVFMFSVVPLQRQLRDIARAGVASGTFDYAKYHARALRWEYWGAVALLTPLVAMVLMVLKPNL